MKISLKQFIIEGGNAEIDGHTAGGIDLKRLSRSDVVRDVGEALKAISDRFGDMFGEPLWSDELLASRKFMSGSTLHLFSQGISDREFVGKKPKVGDIDVMVDAAKGKDLVKMLDLMRGHDFGKLRLLAHKPTGGAQISLWQYGGGVIQIDFEMVDYAGGEPTEWSRFSRSSDWGDIKAGLKGAMHKLLMRSLMSKDKVDMLVQLKTKYKDEVSSEWALSPTGMRRRYEPTGEEREGRKVYRKLEGEYVRDIKAIFERVFGAAPTGQDLADMWTFGGMLRLIQDHFSPDQQRRTVETFLDLLFGDGAQGLYRGDPVRDKIEKMAAVEAIKKFGLPIDQRALDEMVAKYYKNYR